MPIHLIVDGYNLARTESGAADLALEEQRGQLIRRLAAYRRARRLEVTVVFDAAGGTSAGGEKSSRAGVSVVFTRIGETADQRIERLTRDAGPGCVVVTSDRLLADLVRRRGIETLDSTSLLAKMEQAAWMEVKGGSEDQWLEPTRRAEKKGPSRRLKKRERQRVKLLTEKL